MTVFIRNKRVTNLFDDDARARLMAADNRKLSHGDDSVSLSHLVHSFLEENTTCNHDSVTNEFDSDRVHSVNSLNSVIHNNADPYKNTLLEHVSEALENFAFLKERNNSLLCRSVAEFLIEKGYDATVCVTAWESSIPGSHEFIDVVKTGSATWRYFVDLDFRAQFEIARPTRQFAEVLSFVPGVFVGGEKELKRTVLVLCDAAKRCFRSRGLSIPPWRKNRFMENKWFGPCRRTVNPVQGKPVRVTEGNGVSCRLLGFDDVVMESKEGGVVSVRIS